ncbi:alpha/beta hydrolase [soil metagenome]
MPSEEAVALAAMLRTLPAPDGITVDEWRSRAGTPDDPDAAGVRTETIDAGGVRAVRATLGDVADEPVMVWFHGGGFVVCTAETHRVSAAHAAARIGGSAIVPDYRLAPEHPFPAAVDDGVAVMRWLRDRGVDPARTVIAGDSAGGNLALTVTLALRDAGEPLPAAIVTVSPWTDLTLSAPSLVTNLERDPFGHLDDLPRMRDLYLQGADARDPRGSPLFADLAGLPPVLAMVGDTETMLDDSVRLVDAIREAGGEAELAVIEGAFHTWLQYPVHLPEAEIGLDTIAAFLDARL